MRTSTLFTAFVKKVLVATTFAALATACGLKVNPVGLKNPSGSSLSDIPAEIVVVSGDGQSALPSAALSDPIVVRVNNVAHGPVANVTVTFAIATGGGSLGATTVTTDSQGLAQVTWTLGAAVGAQSITASVAGVPSVTINATATMNPPANLVIISGNNQSGTVGQTLAAPLVVEVTDASSNPLSNITVTFAVTAGGGTPSVVSATTDGSGRAQVNWTIGTVAGAAQTLRVSSAGLTSVDFSATAVAGTATQLAYSVQPSNTATAGADLATQPSVQIRDTYGNVVNSTATITLTAYTDSACTTTTATGTLNSGSLAATAGTSAFSGVDYSKTETIYLRASSPGLTSACSSAIAVSSAAASQLVYTVQPSATATAGTDFATQPSVQIRDAFGNLVSSTATITLTAYTDSACTTTLATGTLNSGSLAATAGTSAFTGVDYSKAETIYLRASSAGLTSACSNAIAVSAGSANQLAFSVQPATTATAGVDLTTQPSVQVRDANGNVVSSTATIALTAYTDAACTTTLATGTLNGGSLAATAGTAAFTSVDYTKAETIYLRASSAGLTSACSTAIAVSANSANQLAYSVQPSSTVVAGVDLATQPSVQIRDAYGNLVNSTATITLTAYTDSACTTTTATGTLNSGSLAATAGTSAFSGVDYSKAETIYLRASSAGLTFACSNAIAVSAASANQLAFSVQPAATATAGVDLTTQPSVQVRDAFGNLVSSTATITLAAYTDSACTTTAGTGTLNSGSLAATAGTAAFTGVDYSKAETIYLRATSAGLTMACSTAIAVSAAAASELVFSVQPSSTATAGVNFATPPTVQARDAYGNVATGSSASILLAAYRDSGCTIAADGSVTATSNPMNAASGVAAFTAVKNSVAGTIYLKATSAGLTAACSTVIAVTNAASALAVSPTTFTPSTSNSTAFVVGGRYFAEAVRLADGNVLITGGRNSTGATNIVNIATLYNATTNRLAGLPAMDVKRVGHSMTLLPSGKVLVVGGMVDNTNATTSVQIYNPITQKWTKGAALASARAYHTATLLDNGKVFVAGGSTGAAGLQSTVLYDPSTDSWESGPAMASVRSAHGAAKLADGKVLIVGGNDGTAARLASAEIYDPATHAFTATGSLGTGREEFGQAIFVTSAEAGAATYPQGAVFVGGGYDGTNILSSVEIYNVATGAWAAGNAMGAVRRYPSFVKLSDGKIFVAGGHIADGTIDQTNTSQYFDLTTGTWTNRANMTTLQGLSKRSKFPAVLLANGKVFIFGGANGSSDTPQPYSFTWDPSTNTWALGPTFGIPVNIGFLWKLADGRVMNCGGALNNVANSPTRTCEYYDPATNQFVDAPWMNVARHRYDFAQLPDGRVVVAGGSYNGAENVLRDVEIFDPATETWTVKGNAPVYGMNRAAFLPIGGSKILAAGGQGGAAATDANILSSAYIYDADADTWTPAAALPQTLARSRFVRTPGGRIFVGGGWNGTAVVDTLYEYNVGTTPGVDDSWTTRAASGQVQSWHMLNYYELGGNGYLASMGGNAGYANSTSVNVVKIYDIANDTWATGATLPVKRVLTGAIMQDTGKIVIFPGYTGSATNVIYEYTPGSTPGTNDSFATLAPNGGANRCNTMGNETILNDGRLYIHGGVCNTSSWVQVAEVYSRVNTQTITPSGGDGNYTLSLFSGVGTLYPKLNLFVPPYPFPASGSQSVIRVQDGLGGSADSTGTYP